MQPPRHPQTMRVFIYEHMTAAGIGRETFSPDHGMYLEGRAMRDAVAEDFGCVPGVELSVFPDAAAPVDRDSVRRAAEQADRALVIAPELDDILADLVATVQSAGCSLLGPSLDAIRLTSDKLALAEHWRGRGVPTPATTDRLPSACDAFPVVWKPRDGAGSTETFLIRDRFELCRALASRQRSGPMILQEYVPGLAASVAFVCGPTGPVPLMPGFQLLNDDGRFGYRGGELPLPPVLASRAIALGLRAIECVPELTGYVGVDLVLGAAEDGTGDCAIELNPRLTTSYIGLRALANFNVAEVILRAAVGESVGELKWKPGRVRFGADGRVRVL
jgi:tyramine---L-glutamate ligase